MAAPLNHQTLAVDARHLKSGIGTYLKSLIPLMIQRSDWRWKLIGPAYWSRYENERVEWVPCEYGIYSLKEHRLIPRLTQSADVLWTPQYNAPWFCGSRLVVTLHDMIHCMKEYPRPWLKSLLSHQVMSRALKQSEKVITVSHYSKERMVEFFPSVKDKVEVIHNGVQKVPEEHGEPLFKYPYILSFGNALTHKNFPRLIESYVKIADHVEAHLVIAGFPGADSEAMKKAAATCPEKVHLLPSQDQEGWGRLLHHAHLYVCPSLEEGFGLPPLEALDAKVPVAVSKRASLPEVLQDAAFWFDPLNTSDMSQTLVKACQDAEGRERVLSLGRQRVAHFTWQKSAEKHVKLFAELFA